MEYANGIDLFGRIDNSQKSSIVPKKAVNNPLFHGLLSSKSPTFAAR